MLFDSGGIPPVLTLGQITTVVWLATARTLESLRVTKELLATCYNAVRPSAAWTQQFSQALDSFRTANPGAIEQRANAALFLQVARNNARDESYGQAAVLRKVNVAELFAEAAATARAQEQERDAQVERLQGEYREAAQRQAEEATARQAQIARDAQDQIELTARLASDQMQKALRLNEEERIVIIATAAETAAKRVVAEQRAATLAHRRRQASKLTYIVMLAIRIVISLGLSYLLFLLSIDQWEAGTVGKMVVSAVLAFLLFLANMDLSGVEIVKIPAKYLEGLLKSMILNLIVKLDPPIETNQEHIEPTFTRLPTDRQP